MLVVLQRVDGTGVTFDATPQESHSSRATATKFPVERIGGGVASISDHVIEEPDTLSLVGVVGAAPLEVVRGLSVRGMPLSEGRARKAYDDLRRMKSDGALLKAFTLFRSYENMVITALDVPVDVSTHETMVATIQLVQVRSAVAQQTASLLPGSIRKDGRRTGRPPKKKPDVPTSARDRASALLKVFDFGSGGRIIGTLTN